METVIGQIAMFGFSFAPRNWSFCAGQLLPIAQFNSIFSLVGTFYGGDARTTFGLPDLRGRSPLGVAENSQGPGLSPYVMGQKGGIEFQTLAIAALPPHRHNATFTPSGGGGGEPADVQVSTSKGSHHTPAAGDYLAAPKFGAGISVTEVHGYVSAAQQGTTVPLGGVSGGGGGGGGSGGTVTVADTGSGSPFDVRSPFQGLNFCFAMDGIFPSRS